MTKEEFDKGFKLLKRFLKDEGCYQTVLKGFLFINNRPKLNLFEEFNSKKYHDVDNWCVLFNRINLMTGEKYSFSKVENFYNKNIRDTGLIDRWKDFYKKIHLNNMSFKR